MNTKTFAGSAGIAAGLAMFVLVGSAAAQTAPTVSTNASTASFGPGTNVELGTVVFTGGSSNASIVSIPMTVTPSGNGTLSQVSNCGFFNPSGPSLTAPVTLSSGASIFTFATPFVVNASTTVALSFRCDLASSTPAGTMYRISAGTPTLGAYAATSSTGAGTSTGSVNANASTVNLNTAPSVPAGSTDVSLGTISLSGPSANTGGIARITSIPITITPSSGASVMNCRIRSPQSPGTTLTGMTSVSAGSPATFAFTTPYPLIAGSSIVLSFACDVPSTAPAGSSVGLSLAPGGVVATDQNGATVAAGAQVGTNASGLPASLSGTVMVTGGINSGSTSSYGSQSNASTSNMPNVPNTGAGGNALETILMLVSALLVAAVSGIYLRRSLS